MLADKYILHIEFDVSMIGSDCCLSYSLSCCLSERVVHLLHLIGHAFPNTRLALCDICIPIYGCGISGAYVKEMIETQLVHNCSGMTLAPRAKKQCKKNPLKIFASSSFRFESLWSIYFVNIVRTIYR